MLLTCERPVTWEKKQWTRNYHFNQTDLKLTNSKTSVLFYLTYLFFLKAVRLEARYIFGGSLTNPFTRNETRDLTCPNFKFDTSIFEAGNIYDEFFWNDLRKTWNDRKSAQQWAVREMLIQRPNTNQNNSFLRFHSELKLSLSYFQESKRRKTKAIITVKIQFCFLLKCLLWLLFLMAYQFSWVI